MNYTLPNGKIFTPWCDETQYTKILRVSQKNGSSDGTGSESKPFLTISQTVPFATPGTKVIIDLTSCATIMRRAFDSLRSLKMTPVF